jgi:hypothetical protein
VLKKLTVAESQEALVKKALDHAWRWVEDLSVPAAELHSIALEIDSIAQKSTGQVEVNGLTAFSTALLYESWCPYPVHIGKGICGSSDVPGELADVDESSISLVEEAAVATGFMTTAYVDNVLNLMVSVFGTESPNSLGSPVSRSLFG